MDVTIFGIDLKVDPVAFTIGDAWTVYWYGIIIAVGFALAIVYGLRNAKRLGINVDKMIDVVLVTTPLAILCARLYYMIFFEKTFGFKEFFGIGTGAGFSGLAIYGGVIGAAVVGFIMCKIKKVNFLDMFDLAAIGFLIGQGIGRWGNFINQEAFGGPTGSSFWGMTSKNVERAFASLGYDPSALAHPCFLYESIWCLIGVLVLHLVSKKRKFSGQIAVLYCVWYGFGRAIIELLRTDSLMIGPFKVSFLVSITACIAGAVYLYIRLRRPKEEAAYVPVFAEQEDEMTSDEIIVEGETQNGEDN